MRIFRWLGWLWCETRVICERVRSKGVERREVNVAHRAKFCVCESDSLRIGDLQHIIYTPSARDGPQWE